MGHQGSWEPALALLGRLPDSLPPPSEEGAEASHPHPAEADSMGPARGPALGGEVEGTSLQAAKGKTSLENYQSRHLPSLPTSAVLFLLHRGCTLLSGFLQKGGLHVIPNVSAARRAAGRIVGN